MKLELRIPPLVLILIFAALMWMVAGAFGTHEILLPYRYTGMIGLVFLGLVIALAGVMSFRRAATTVNPLDPEASTALVVSGVYRFTRNPMYLGFLLFLLGYGLYLSSIYSLLCSLGFIA